MTSAEINRTVERPGRGSNGVTMLLVLVALIAGAALNFWIGVEMDAWPLIFFGSIAFLAAVIFVASGFYMVQPNQGVAITLFGDYSGTDRRPGLRWSNQTSLAGGSGRAGARPPRASKVGSTPHAAIQRAGSVVGDGATCTRNSATSNPMPPAPTMATRGPHRTRPASTSW